MGDDSISSRPFNERKLDEFVSSKIENLVTQDNIPPITVQEVVELIDRLSCSKATGPDAICVKILQLVSPVFCHPLTKLLNLSIAKGIFPSKWKIARVTPLYKAGPHKLRPISVLSVLSKIFEKHVAKSLMGHLVNNQLLYKLQSVFRAGHSNESPLIKLTDQILFNMDQDKSGMVFIDLRNAFDVVDHQLLLTKLRLYRMGDSAPIWSKILMNGRLRTE